MRVWLPELAVKPPGVTSFPLSQGGDSGQSPSPLKEVSALPHLPSSCSYFLAFNLGALSWWKRRPCWSSIGGLQWGGNNTVKLLDRNLRWRKWKVQMCLFFSFKYAYLVWRRGTGGSNSWSLLGRFAAWGNLDGRNVMRSLLWLNTAQPVWNFIFAKLKTSLFSSWRGIPVLILNLSSSKYEIWLCSTAARAM